MRRSFALLSLFLLTACFSLNNAHGAVTQEQRAKVQQLVDMTREAGELYTSGKLTDSAAKVTEIQTALVELLKSKDPALQRLVRPVYSRLGRAHGLLELEGAELEPLPAWDDLTSEMAEPPEPGPGGSSFKDEVAPMLITSCGNCHINNRRGNFSMATFADLMKGPPAGTVIFAGSDTGNRIVEVIESGDMPRGGGKVAPEQLAALKKWIAEGAKFDGPDPAAPLASFAKGAAPAAATPAMKVQKATGKETVSFARDIAPLLKENCNGCHIAGRQASGNFRMDNFTQLLRGGDSGAVIASKNPEESLIVKKIKGESGQRMPAGGRPALSNEQIELISTWISEGATFDGPAANSNIDVVINQAWASAASHDELMQRRKERALASWKRVLPNDEPSSAGNDEVFVLGNVPPSHIEKIVTHLAEATSVAKKKLDAPAREPLVKGGIMVFVLKSRYDYSEFGRMTENRELPKGWIGHWMADPLDVYGVVAADDDIDDNLSKSLALQIVSGAYLGSFSEVPTWFAEGVARNLVITNHRRHDDRIKVWQASIAAAGSQIDNAKTLLDGRLDEEAAGVVGMALTNFMMDGRNRRRFDKLLELLRDGKTFNDAVTYTYAPPEVLIKTWLGK